MNLLEKAFKLKNDFDKLRPISKELESKILQKIRLDWNYNSNHLEGNQLTFGETKALILFGLTAQGKPLQDHLEISRHNEALNWIDEIVKNETPITDTFIRQLHEILLKKPYKKESINENNQIVYRNIEIGKYKTVPNHVKTITGEKFYFANPEETPAKMNDLMDWYRLQITDNQTNPILLATEFHYKFIRIHPFDDGNGRMARLLMNLILMQFGFPPAIIKSEDKLQYFNVLRLADADNFEPFFEFIVQNVIQTLELMIKGANGESIDEQNDLDKKLALLELDLNKIDSDDQIKLQYDFQVFTEFLNTWLKTFIIKITTNIQKFNKFFTFSNHRLSYGDSDIKFIDEDPEIIFENFKEKVLNNSLYPVLKINVGFGPFIKGGLNSFGCNYELEIQFDMIKYSFLVDKFNDRNRTRELVIEKLLHKSLSVQEIDEIGNVFTSCIYDHIDYYTKKNGIR